MSIRTVPNTDLSYHLLCFDKHGAELNEDDGLLGSQRVQEALEAGAVTDVFVMSHGWKGDVPGAIVQYDAWIGAMAQCAADRQRARGRWPKFAALLIGFHWPSLPWGEETPGGSFAAEATGDADAFVSAWADRIADTPKAREALRVLYDAALAEIEPERLPNEVIAAYRTLEGEAGLESKGVGAPPEADREPMDPQLAYEEWLAESEASFGGGVSDGLLSPLRQLSFWTMKKRARTVGTRGGNALVRAIGKAPAKVRLHLMGHSFGCIVVSSMLRGPDGGEGASADTAMLVQGAMSHWSFCEDIPHQRGSAGYFHPVVAAGRVQGPIVVTTSTFDKAVGRLYPWAAAAARQVSYAPGAADLPKYGAIGTFGICGDTLPVETRDVSPALDHEYKFRAGVIYNVRSDRVIRTGEGLSGAHSDIAHPPIGHAFWEAVLATAGR